MYCSIEMNTLRVLHVNHAMTVVDSLARIEATAPPYDILTENTNNRSFLHGLTELELTTLYRNLTGKELDPAAGALVMRAAIAHVVNNLPPREASNDELHAQLEYVWANPGPVYRYVKGSMLPAIPDKGLWPVQGKHLSQAEYEAATLAAAQLTEKGATPVAEPAKRAPSRPAAAPVGGSRPYGAPAGRYPWTPCTYACSAG